MKKLFLIAFFYTTFSLAESNLSWVPVISKQLEIKQGSALDFSALVETGPAGRHGPVRSNLEGHLVFSGLSDKPQRFMCASQPYGSQDGFPDHQTADKYARQLKLHGYNLARFHFVENVLMRGKHKDFDFDPVQLDRFYYFMAALKKEGIYWMMDALTSWNGAYGDVGPSRWRKVRNVKLGLYYDNKDKEHWKELVNKIFTEKNPYTNQAPLEDPALMGIILVNEGGLNPLINKEASEAMNSLFRDWLVQRYGSVAEAMEQWGGAKPELPRKEWTSSARMKDAQIFYFEIQNTTLKWMTEYFRNLGYQGLLSSYDNWFHLQDIATRSKLAWVDLHAYHDHPNGFVEKGASIQQISSFPDGVKYIREMMAARYWSKPLTVSEYGQPFWNKWRFEAGLAVGAYASFQDWDLICRHSNGPIEFSFGATEGSRRQAIHPFGIALDPVARAGETLATLLFLRRDVQPAKHRVAININAQYALEDQAGIGKIPDAISKIGLVTGLGLIWTDTEKTKLDRQFDWILKPDDPAPTLSTKIVNKLNLWIGRSGEKWEKNLQFLRLQGILSQDNVSNSERFQSETGEITLDTKDLYLKVNTDNTQALAFANSLPSGLPNLDVLSASVPALVALSSLDDQKISKSKRLLLIIATDAHNTGMKFQDDQAKILEELGHLPVKMKTGHFLLQIKNENFAHLSLYALSLYGERKSSIKLTKGDNGVTADIDLSKLPDGITTFFELIMH